MEDNNEKVELLDESDLNAVQEPNQVQEQTQVEPVVQEPVQTEPVVPVQTQAPIEPEKKKSNKGIIILLILVVLGALGYFAYQKFKPEEKVVENKKKEVETTYRMSGNGLEAFDLYFMQLENNNKNVVYSPLSIKYALAMLSEGAKGDTKTQIDDIIGDYKANKYPNNNHMSFANAIFIRDTYKESVKEEYISSLKDKYNAEIILDPFTSPDNINNWISEKTLKLINNIIGDVSGNDLLLVNALAIDMNWKNRIQCASAELPEGTNQMYYGVSYIHENYSDSISCIEGDNNYPSIKFNGVEDIKSVEVGASFNHYDIIKDKGEDNIRQNITNHYQKYLDEHPEEVEICPPVKEYVDKYIKEIGENYKKADVSTDYYISDNDNELVFAKDLQEYDGKTLQYIGIMPKKDELSTYVKNMKADSISKVINEMKEVKYDSFEEGVITQIKGKIPLFKYDYKFELQKDLEELGITNIFDKNKVDLSNMVEGPSIVNKSFHSANIEFSNDGIKAAAVTVIGDRGSTGGGCQYEEYIYDVPVKKIDLTFDKPYLFLIRDKSTGEVWFAGTVYEPTKNNK